MAKAKARQQVRIIKEQRQAPVEKADTSVQCGPAVYASTVKAPLKRSTEKNRLALRNIIFNPDEFSVLR